MTTLTSEPAGAIINIPSSMPVAIAFDALCQRRYSCRAFLDQPVPRDTVLAILERAQRAPSWCNAQPWQLHIASGEPLAALRTSMYEASASEPHRPDIPFPTEFPGMCLQRRRELGFRLYESVGIAKGDRLASAQQARENFRMFGAPHVAFVSSPSAMGAYGVVDCGSYVANFMLAATSLGVATLAQAAMAAYPDIVRSHLGIAADRLIVFGIAFGYEDSSHPANSFRIGRASVQDAVVWVDDNTNAAEISTLT